MTHTETSIIRILAIISAVFCALVVYFTLVAVGFDGNVLANKESHIMLGTSAGAYFGYAMLSDILGFYLLQLPIAVYFWRKYRSINPGLMDYATIAGVLYCLTGAIGAAILSVAWPFLASAFDIQEMQTSRDLLQIIFNLQSDIVAVGIWGRVEFLLSAVWWGFLGLTLVGHSKAIGITSIVLGIASLIAWIGYMLQVDQLAATGLNIYMIAVLFWLASIAMFEKSSGPSTL